MTLLFLIHNSGFQINWQEFLRKINEIRNQLKESDLNSYKILTNGLFILAHELNNVILMAFMPSSPPNPTFTDIINVIKESMQAYTMSERQKFTYQMGLLTGYKADHRDHEFILKGVKDQNSQDLFPPKEVWKQFDDKKKMQAVQDGYERFWTTFLTIIEGYSSR